MGNKIQTGLAAGKAGKSPSFRHERVLIICDFDGTACSIDMGSKVLDRFAGEGWREIDRAYCTDTIGSRLAYSKIAPLFRGSRAQMVKFVHDHATLDPHFVDFYRFCRERGYDLKIASDGLDFYIETVLGKWGLKDIEFFSNAVTRWHQEGITISFPHVNMLCGKCGTCKSSIVTDFQDHYKTIIYIGDSYSDVCPSQVANLVFAKYILYEKCRDNGTACIRYETFRDVMDDLETRYPVPAQEADSDHRG